MGMPPALCPIYWAQTAVKLESFLVFVCFLTVTPSEPIVFIMPLVIMCISREHTCDGGRGRVRILIAPDAMCVMAIM